MSTAILLVLSGTHIYAFHSRFHSNLQRQSSLVSMSSLLYVSPWCLRLSPSNGLHFQAALGVSASYDALVDLFECVGNFLNRLRIYSEIPFSPSMSGIIAKILVEVLSVLSLATKQIKQGRLSMCFRNLDIPCSSYELDLRKVCKEVVRRKRNRGCSPKVGPAYPGRGSHDRNRDTSSCSCPCQQYEARHGWYAATPVSLNGTLD